MIQALSDWQAASLLGERDPATLDPYLVYKGCVAYATNGETHSAEMFLDASYSQLLFARRQLKSFLDFELARTLKFEIPLNHERFFELSGDREHLLGSLFNRASEPELAVVHFNKATEFFRQGRDPHRALRSQINKAICISSLASHTHGELFFLKQRARRDGFHDLVGNIAKAAVSVWLNEGNFVEAQHSSLEATAAYALDGCPEDRAVSMALLAISQVLLGQIEDAKRSVLSVLVRDGKVQIYLDIVSDLLLRKIPKLPPLHHLSGVKWALKSSPKTNSIPGQILKHLSAQSLKRDELIVKVWGEGATDMSYCARLHTAINELRHKFQINVQFDGEAYHLATSANRKSS